MNFQRMTNFLHIRKNILSKMTIILIAIILCSLIVITAIWSNYALSAANTMTLSHATDLIRNSNLKFENDLFTIINNLHHVAKDKTIINFSKNSVAGKAQFDNYYSTMSEDLNGLAVIFPDTLYSIGNSYFSKDIMNSKIYEDIISASSEEIIFNRFSNSDTDQINNNMKIISIGLKIGSDNAKGILIADIKSHLFVKHFGISNMNGIFRTVLADNNSNVIFSSERNLPHSSIHDLIKYVHDNKLYNTFFDTDINNEKYTVIAKPLATYPQWVNITFFPKGSLYQSYYETLHSVIWIIIFVIILTVLFIWLLLTTITKKFKKLFEYTENIDLKNVNSIPQIPQNDILDEIDIVADKIYSMVSTLAEQVNLISDMEEKKHTQELEALRAQINPHFIYNSLNVIQTLSDTQKNFRISEIANSLSSLLRYSATNTDGFVTLRDEIEHITNYITIMQNKFLNKINLLIDIEPEIFDCSMLKMCLQPITENSVRHGLTDSPDNYIMIKAYSDDDTVTIQIIDNGTGIPEEKLKDILDYSDNQSEHLGLKNVDRRLKLTFGAEYGLDIFSTPNVQTIVTITIPYIEKGDLENE